MASYGELHSIRLTEVKPRMTDCTTDLTRRISRASILKYWMRKLLAVKRRPETIARKRPIRHFMSDSGVDVIKRLCQGQCDQMLELKEAQFPPKLP